MLARILLLVTIAVFIVLFAAADAGFDIAGLNDQVQAQQTTLSTHQTELDNHEARITNTEHDVTALQTTTNTPPATERVEVPTEPTPTVDNNAPVGVPNGATICQDQTGKACATP